MSTVESSMGGSSSPRSTRANENDGVLAGRGTTKQAGILAVGGAELAVKGHQ